MIEKKNSKAYKIYFSFQNIKKTLSRLMIRIFINLDKVDFTTDAKSAKNLRRSRRITCRILKFRLKNFQ